jgi:hypothetical protein
MLQMGGGRWMKKRYYVGFLFNNRYGIDAENKEEAEKKGRALIAELVQTGFLGVEVSQAEKLIPCDGCKHFLTRPELIKDKGKKLCYECFGVV